VVVFSAATCSAWHHGHSVGVVRWSVTERQTLAQTAGVWTGRGSRSLRDPRDRPSDSPSGRRPMGASRRQMRQGT
jgi:hypothetical protein